MRFLCTKTGFEVEGTRDTDDRPLPVVAICTKTGILIVKRLGVICIKHAQSSQQLTNIY